jgi:hypothetical protein
MVNQASSSITTNVSNSHDSRCDQRLQRHRLRLQNPGTDHIHTPKFQGHISIPDKSVPWRTPPALRLTYRTTAPQKKPQPRNPVREVLRKRLPNGQSWAKEERRTRRDAYSHGSATETYSRFVKSVARFVIGTAAGYALNMR